MSISSKKNKIPVLLLFGPTGVGKTEVLFSLQEQLRAIDKIDIEIISADSMQVYRQMDIGTAKPQKKDRERLPHWCIDIRNPDEPFDLGDFVTYADEQILQIIERGCFPVISGGTAFYFKHFLYGLPDTPSVPMDIRLLVAGLIEKNGNVKCMEVLKRIDPRSAGRIHINDTYRISRALEIYYASGKPLSSFELPKERRKEYRALTIGLKRDRGFLYQRINARVDKMFVEGLRKEVEALIDHGYSIEDPGLKGIGYKEFLQKSRSDTEIAEEIKRNTRRYAKRQMTFFSSLSDVHWIQVNEPDQTAGEIRKRIVSFITTVC